MPSLKHVVKRRVHKERHQPAARQRLGLLEKHKDYVKRAKDYHKKEKTIAKLHEKAFYRNKDEFYYKMINSQVKKGRLVKKVEHLSQDALKLLDTQDERYVAMRRQMDEKQIEKAQQRLHFLNMPRPKEAVHKIFVDDDAEEEREDDDEGPELRNAGGGSSSSSSSRSRGHEALKNFDLAAHFDTYPELLARTSNRPRKATFAKQRLKSSSLDEAGVGAVSAYRGLLQRQERSQKLRKVVEEFQLRTQLKGKGRRMKVQDATETAVAQYKWFRERKK